MSFLEYLFSGLWLKGSCRQYESVPGGPLHMWMACDLSFECSGQQWFWSPVRKWWSEHQPGPPPSVRMKPLHLHLEVFIISSELPLNRPSKKANILFPVYKWGNWDLGMEMTHFRLFIRFIMAGALMELLNSEPFFSSWAQSSGSCSPGVFYKCIDINSNISVP